MGLRKFIPPYQIPNMSCFGAEVVDGTNGGNNQKMQHEVLATLGERHGAEPGILRCVRNMLNMLRQKNLSAREIILDSDKT